MAPAKVMAQCINIDIEASAFPDFGKSPENTEHESNNGSETSDLGNLFYSNSNNLIIFTGTVQMYPEYVTENEDYTIGKNFIPPEQR